MSCYQRYVELIPCHDSFCLLSYEPSKINLIKQTTRKTINDLIISVPVLLVIANDGQATPNVQVALFITSCNKFLLSLCLIKMGFLQISFVILPLLRSSSQRIIFKPFIHLIYALCQERLHPLGQKNNPKSVPTPRHIAHKSLAKSRE